MRHPHGVGFLDSFSGEDSRSLAAVKDLVLFMSSKQQ